MARQNKLLIYEKYSEILDGIFIYQNQQVEIREMCLRIMLGTFALVGGLLFVKVDLSSQIILIMNSAFPILSLIIVTVSLTIDLVYKERLKLAFASEALRLESDHSWLPKFHYSLLSGKRQEKLAASGQIVYYFGCSGLLLLLSAISLALDPLFSSLISKIFIFLAYTFFYFLYSLVMSKIVKRTEDILEMFNG